MEGDRGAAQDAIKYLADEDGLSFIAELADHHTHKLGNEINGMEFWTTEVKPLFQLLTHDRVVTSLSLEQQVAILFNFVHGVGGSRMVRLFGCITKVVQSWLPTATDMSCMEVAELSLAVLSKILDYNTTVIINASISGLVASFSNVLQDAKVVQPGDDFSRMQASKYIDYIQRRLGVGEAIASWESPAKLSVTREQFVLRRDLPGRLSAQGPRHNNDHADISKIKILPTPDEINSPRGEYLPTVDASQWHLPGMQGRIDREFRLLREDTIGQLRDAVRETLEHIRMPKGERARHSTNSIRTYTYEFATPVAVEIDSLTGLELVVQCCQPAAVRKLTSQKRREWWKWSKSLQAGALVCVLDVRGSISFFSVSESTMRSADDKRARKKNMVAGGSTSDAEDSPPAFTLSEDENYLYVRLQLIDSRPNDVSHALQWYRGIGSAPRQYLVEFPGVLLASFMHTLESLQKIFTAANVPFSEILSPASDSFGSVSVKAPQYAMKPGFSFNLKCLIKDGSDFLVSPTSPGNPDELESKSMLDFTQSVALLNTLIREVSIIQGPPGTGKSFTGEKIVKVALANKKQTAIGPILCVCYTNHALDQVLEHLIDDGVTSIIRIGSRSKSERLENFNLRAIARKVDRTKYEGRELWNVHTAMNEIIRGYNQSLEQLAKYDTWSSIRAFLKRHNPDHELQLFGEEREGWTLVQRQADRVIGLWLQGGLQTAVQPRQLEVLEKTPISLLTHPERAFLHRHWLKEIRDPIISDVTRAHASYTTTKEKKDRLHREVDLRCLQQADIIGVTTTGLARNSELLRKLKCKVLICEEAGEVLEAHLLTALLPSVEHVILIGDHLQLRPQIQNYELQSTNPRGAQYSLDMSMFERLVKPPNDSPAFPFDILETQRRMHPSIAELVRSTLYPSLEDAESVKRYPLVPGLKDRLFWLHHEHPEGAAESHDPVNTSHSNSFEVDMTTALVSHLVRQGEYGEGDIAVLTPYLGQLQKLRRRMESMFEISLGDRDLEELATLETENIEAAPPTPQPAIRKSTLLQNIRLATVDNFQGEEARVVVISLVRSNPQNNCGFLSTPNRINVLLSRAKHGMYIIGNSNTCMKVPMWASVIRLLKGTGRFGTQLVLQCPRHPHDPMPVSKPDHFVQYAPESGCNLPCDRRLSCGHACTGRCHSDVLHSAVKCLADCPRPMKGCDHPCPNRCGDACRSRCDVVLELPAITLPCGHKRSHPKCWEAQHPEDVICITSVRRRVPGCSHEVSVPCHVDVSAATYRCDVDCGYIRQCGHACKSRCSQCNTRQDGKVTNENHGLCNQVCGRNHTACRHSCQKTCHGENPCPPCGQACEVRCGHSRCSKPCHEPCAPCAEKECHSQCPHTQCTMPCAAPCNWVPCSKRCEKLIGCGHRCPSLCGEPCPETRFCQLCGSDDIKSTCVDFLEMKEYHEIDLDEQPCIFPDCGHFLTVTSMDGQMDMQAHYEMDGDGFPSALRGATTPFSAESATVKVCANCRGSLRSVGRYGRIVRRAMLDEATKKFIAWSNAYYKKLVQRFLKQQEVLESTPFSKTIATAPSSTRSFASSTSRIKQLHLLKNAVGNGRYEKFIGLRNELHAFAKNVQKEEQPFQRVADLVRHANRQNDGRTGDLFHFDESAIQVKGYLLATALLLKCDVVILGDFINICKNNSPFIPQVKLNLTSHIQDCTEMVRIAHETVHPREEVQGHLYLAQLYAFLQYLNGREEQGARIATTSGVSKLDNSPDDLIQSARHHVNEAQALMDRNPSTSSLQRELEAVQVMLKDGSYEQVTAQEMKEVYDAMAREFLGTGHWYRCENGHPFTIGECGMAMQLARCPECGATVGGQSHQSAEGVQRANDIDELARGVHNLGI
ncbi:hypothetical protein B0I35DRAFT_152968 [Stachybotrys elegans]|uniref:RZ-type domain-containing protein n=1 Tax=Stachybotrys elegans TaxID=80388 RepID=A0A8K0SIF2_9HYPO|nr:hypothetical protein B0I35DRAFT_152968 [Stachybotrys elegans]